MKIKAKELSLTPDFTFIKGQFALHNYCIPYYMLSVKWDRMIENFSILDDLPQVARMEWKLSELFQRDINWDRVRNSIARYLRNDAVPQFFNALTIALLPKGEDYFAANFSKTEKYPPLQDSGLEEAVTIGGIQIAGYEGADGLVGKLRWDKDLVVAVAVDGQHRLAAMREAKAAISESARMNTSVPVIIIVPDKRTGFSVPPAPTGGGTAQTMRRLFTDLNKHAQ